MSHKNPLLHSSSVAIADWISNERKRLVGRETRMQIRSSEGIAPVAGQEFVITIPKQGNQWLIEPVLWITVSQVTKTGGTFARLINGFGLFCLEYIRLFQNGVQRLEAFSMDIYNKLMMHNRREDYEMFKANLGIADANERNTLASSNQTFALNLDQVFAIFTEPLPIFLLNSDIELRFKFRSPISQLIETDGSNPSFSYINTYLYCGYIEPPGVDEFALLLKKEKTYPLYDVEVTEVLRVAQGNSSQKQFSWPIAELNNKDVKYLTINALYQSDESVGSFTNYLELDSWKLMSSSKYLTNELFDTTQEYFRKVLAYEYNFAGHEAIRSTNLYIISWMYDHESCCGNKQNQYNGSRDFTGVTDAEITVNFKTAPISNVNVHIYLSAVKRMVITEGKLMVVS